MLMQVYLSDAWGMCKASGIEMAVKVREQRRSQTNVLRESMPLARVVYQLIEIGYPQEADLFETDLTAATSTSALSRTTGQASSSNLFSIIDLRQSSAINLEEPESLASVLRPHNERDDMDKGSIANLDGTGSI